jgi:hypothetical protein
LALGWAGLGWAGLGWARPPGTCPPVLPARPCVPCQINRKETPKNAGGSAKESPRIRVYNTHSVRELATAIY